jgi:hypothetical protein
MLVDAPVNIMNQAPRLANPAVWLANKIMGRNAVPYAGPISDNPLLPSDIIQAPGRALGVRKYEPQGPIESIADRVGQEIGASAVPAAGALVAGSRLGVQGARALATSENPLAALAYGPVEAAAANPSGMLSREALGAGAAGTGAGIANEAARAVTGDDVNPISDLAGSAAGVSALAIAKPILGAVGSLASARGRAPGHTDRRSLPLPHRGPRRRLRRPRPGREGCRGQPDDPRQSRGGHRRGDRRAGPAGARWARVSLGTSG